MLCARRRKVRFAPVPPDGETSTRSLASPLPTQTALLGLRGAPYAAFAAGATLAPREVCSARYTPRQNMISLDSPPAGGELCETF